MAQTSKTIHISVEKPTEVESQLFSPDVSMMLLTWVTFFLLLAILHRYAWKPILEALDNRERTIAKSIEDAEHIKQEMQRLDQTRQDRIAEAETVAQKILDQARKGAREASKVIQEKTREEAKILLENAQREIKEEREKAQAGLRYESAQVAISLAEKLISKNLESRQNQKLVKEFIKNI